MSSTLQIKRFIVLGDAGAGKSSFINFLYNYFHGTRKPDEIFCPHPQVKIAIPCANWIDYLDENHKNNNSERNINDQTKSQTQLCTTYKIQRKTIYLEIIDTPGFNDTNGADIDEKNLAMVETALKQVPFLSGIILVVNGSVPRLGVLFKNFLRMLHQVWPNDLLNNSVAILTNCDELSVNLDSSVLERYLNIDNSKKFYFQNSLFRWDPKNQLPKTMRRFRQNFEDNLDTIKSLTDKLLSFNNVLTTSFEAGAIKVSIIERYISQSIQKMLDLLEKYTEQQVAQAGIKGAQDMMKQNQEWEKHREINAIRWVEVPRRHQLSSSPSHYRHSNQFPLTERQRISMKDQAAYGSTSYDDSDMQSSYSSYAEHLPAECHSTVVQDGRHVTRPLSDAGSALNSDGTNQHLCSPRTSETVYSVQAHDSSLISNQQPTTRPHFHKTSGSHQPAATSDPHHYMSRDGSHCEQRPRESRGGGNQQRDVKSSATLLRSCFGIGDHRSKHSSNSDGSVYQPQQTKIQVTIPDNEAQSHHRYAQQEESKLQKKSYDLVNEQRELKNSMAQLLEHLEKQVAELRLINKNYDVIERNRDLLLIFKDAIRCMSDDSEMRRYYDATVAILSNKSK